MFLWSVEWELTLKCPGLNPWQKENGFVKNAPSMMYTYTSLSHPVCFLFLVVVHLGKWCQQGILLVGSWPKDDTWKRR